MNEITNFEQWVTAKAKHGYIDVIGDEEDGFQLVISDAVLDDAFGWLASRYDHADGEQCIEFIIDEILEEGTDRRAGRLLARMLLPTTSPPIKVASAAKGLRHHYARRKIAYFTDEIVRIVSPSGPDPLDKRKNEIESGLEG